MYNTDYQLLHSFISTTFLSPYCPTFSYCNVAASASLAHCSSRTDCTVHVSQNVRDTFFAVRGLSVAPWTTVNCSTSKFFGGLRRLRSFQLLIGIFFTTSVQSYSLKRHNFLTAFRSQEYDIACQIYEYWVKVSSRCRRFSSRHFFETRVYCVVTVVHLISTGFYDELNE